MTKIVVMGSSGGVGRHAVAAAVAAGHEVVAASRSGEPVDPRGVAVAVDVRDAEAVARVLDGADAVLWCVGVTRRSGPGAGSAGMANVVRATQRLGSDPRVVSVSGAGVTLAGDEKGAGARLVSALTRRLARDLVSDKEAEHAVLAASTLAWTQLRPPRLVDSAATGRWELTRRAPGLTAGAVAKADVAAAMLEQVDDDTWVGSAPFVARPGPA